MKTVFMLFLALFLGIADAKEITIKSKDGFLLKGWIDMPKVDRVSYPLVFIVHQFGSSHVRWKNFAKQMQENGYATLMVDLRGHGDSTLQNSKTNSIIRFNSMEELKDSFRKSAKKVVFKNIPDDLKRWLEYVEKNYKKVDIDNLTFIGASLGASALIGIMFDYEPKVAILLSPGSVKEIDAEDSIGDIASPIMFISSRGDFALDRSIYYTKEASTPTTLILPGSGHGEALLKSSKKYIELFLEKYRR